MKLILLMQNIPLALEKIKQKRTMREVWDHHSYGDRKAAPCHTSSEGAKIAPKWTIARSKASLVQTLNAASTSKKSNAGNGNET